MDQITINNYPLYTIFIVSLTLRATFYDRNSLQLFLPFPNIITILRLSSPRFIHPVHCMTGSVFHSCAPSNQVFHCLTFLFFFFRPLICHPLLILGIDYPVFIRSVKWGCKTVARSGQFAIDVRGKSRNRKIEGLHFVCH